MYGMLKNVAYCIVNDLILAPVGLKLSFRVGSDPVQDMVRLMRDYPTRYIVDGGAHTGSFSRRMALVFPAARIHAFEPSAQVFDKLKRETTSLHGFTAHNVALGARGEWRTFHNNAAAQTSSLSLATEASNKYFRGLVREVGNESVRTVRLCEFCYENGIDQLDIIKLDLQGGEMDALKGAGALLAASKVVFVEVQFLQLYEGSALFSELDMLLRSNGFELYQFYDLVRSPIDGRLLQGDAMFVAGSLFAETAQRSDAPAVRSTLQ